MTSWEGSHKWYDELVGKEGHYYHEHLILPGVLRLLKLTSTSHLLDLGCGQGVLAKAIPPHVNYHGLDLSPSLIKKAKEHAGKNQTFTVCDITKPFPENVKLFTHAAAILSLQNVSDLESVCRHLYSHLHPGSPVVIVFNHPCFRIPRQSSWGVDEGKKLQYRRVDRYMTPMQIPIQTHPGSKEKSEMTTSFHHNLSESCTFFFKAGFVMTGIEEWTSDKKSTGKNAAMENRARAEFPLFLSVQFKK